jgi:hypothetical protein
LKDSRDLEDALMNRYAIEQGHDPAGSWILIVHADGASDMLRFTNPEDMWCCDLAPMIRTILNREQREANA